MHFQITKIITGQKTFFENLSVEHSNQSKTKYKKLDFLKLVEISLCKYG